MKIKRKTKVDMWMAEVRQGRRAANEWLATDEGKEAFRQFRVAMEEKAERVKKKLGGEADETVNMNGVLKQLYPDNVPPAPMWWKP